MLPALSSALKQGNTRPEVLFDCPAAIRIAQFVFRETAYGVVKRLRFLVEYLEKECQRQGLERGDLRVLDLGCGTGTYVTIPLALMGYAVTGIDTNRASIDRARANAALVGCTGIELVCGRLEEHKSEPFHAIVCSEVLEHQVRPDIFLELIRSFLADRGLLLVTVPNGYGYYEVESLICKVFPKLPSMVDRCERLFVRTFGSEQLKHRHRTEYGGIDAFLDRLRNTFEQSSLATDDPHHQHFTPQRVRQCLATGGFAIESFRNNTFLAGNAWNALIRSMDGILRLNARIADFLPQFMTADWFVAARSSSSIQQKEGAKMVIAVPNRLDDPNGWLEALREKWKEIPAGSMVRATSSDLLKLSDEELLRRHQQATTESTGGAGFAIRGWYHELYKDVLKGKRVLDVGSGFGIDGIAFSRGGAKVTFLDVVETNLQVLERLCRLYGLKDVECFYLKELSSLDVLRTDFDVIWCHGSLINAPFDVIRAEAQQLLTHLKANGRWIELAYPKVRWEREGRMPLEKWGERTDGGAPWMEWYDLKKVLALLDPSHFDVVLHFEFHNSDFNWFDLVRRS